MIMKTLGRDPPVRKILIRSTNWIGDAVMTTPAMAAVRATFPESRISVMANPLVAELFNPHPLCDEVVVFDKGGTHRGIPGFFRFAMGLRHQGFDLAILFQNALEAALLAYLARIPVRAGYRTDCRGALLTHGVPVGRAAKALHHTDYYVKMLEALGVSGGDGGLRLHCTPKEELWASQLLGKGFWIAINPGATYGSAKRWVPAGFAKVAAALIQDDEARIVLVGSPGEAAIGQAIEAAVQARPTEVLNMVGKTTVRQLVALLSRCRLLITNDSGPMHVAAALRVPVVALFGPTDHTTTSPFTDRWRMVRKAADCSPCLKRVCPTDHRCMKAITVEDVLSAAKELMEETRE